MLLSNWSWDKTQKFTDLIIIIKLEILIQGKIKFTYNLIVNLITTHFDSDNSNSFRDNTNNTGSHALCHHTTDYGDNSYCHHRYSIYSESPRLFCLFASLLTGKFKTLQIQINYWNVCVNLKEEYILNNCMLVNSRGS